MRIFMTGATGVIGTSVVDELAKHPHDISALVRSDAAEKTLADKGVTIIRGDLRNPEQWIDAVGGVDAVIHVAATFTDDMGEVDRALIEALIMAAKRKKHHLKLIYTGGCWLYGQTGNHIATEEDQLNPIPAFRWMAENSKLASDASNLDLVLIHPAMVYHHSGGAIERFIISAKEQGQIEIWGSAQTRWPVVHRNDLAIAYRLAVEQATAGQIFNVASQPGVWVSEITTAIAKRYGIPDTPFIRNLQDVVTEQGDWAVGPTLDQQMSSEKIKASLGWQPSAPNIITEIERRY